ncbi:unnamed protein product, partial [Polarella glacialis]
AAHQLALGGGGGCAALHPGGFGSAHISGVPRPDPSRATSLLPASGNLALPSQRGSQTPESIPVGVMSSMLRQVSRRMKDLHAAFVPYKPLDPFYTPQTPPPTAPVTPQLLQKLSEFYR